MMLVIGGQAQGKLATALQLSGYAPEQVLDGETCVLTLPEQPDLVLNHVHMVVKRLLQAGKDPLAWFVELARQCPQAVLIADEVGCGVVPADAFERQWREAAGRVCCLLAGQSECVVRVCCGVPVCIKGEIACRK